MTDDIVTRLRELAGDWDYIGLMPKDDLRVAADEIERLRADLIMKNRHIDELAAEIDGYKEWLASKAFAWEEDGVGDEAADEIERLRAAGDALAECLRFWADFIEDAYPFSAALETWEEARRG